MTENTIEREIFIRAGIDHVWSLVSRNGFWVGEELHFETEAKPGETVVFDVPNYGSYPVRVEQLDPPRYAAYRWASSYPGDALTESNSTLVEFTLTEQDGGVLLQFRESGFASLDGDEDFRAASYDESSGGWDAQVEALRRTAEGIPAQ